MPTPLTPLQLLVAKHYCNGEFDHCESMEQAKECGDTLFVFCLNEAGAMSGPYDLRAAIDRAGDELNALMTDLEAY